METLSIEDIQNLNQCIQKIYTLHNLDNFGVDSLSIVDRLVPSDWPLFNLTNTRTGQLSQTSLPSFSGLPAELIKVLEEVLSQDRDNHPIAQNMPQTLNGAYKLSDFISQQELYCREGLYQQFLRPLGVEDQMLFFLPDVNPGKWSELAQADTTLTGFIINRSERSFTERDRLILDLIRPHLFQAYSNAQKYQQLQQNLSQFQQSLNCLDLIILDTEGTIRSIAPQAIIWLETYFSTSTGSSQLPDLLWAWVKHQIAGFTNQIDRPKAYLPLRIQQAGKELTIRLVVEPSGEQYLLLLEEQKPSLLNSLTILGLSQRETEVLAWVMQGKDNKAIAAQLNIGISTVRKHLENTYRKLGVQSRMEASVSALTQLGFVHSLPLM
jgi:DNA-binding CsgD family transcriptional regulator